MSEEGKNRAIAIDFPNQPYYGTFQGVANYYPPPLPPHPQWQVAAFPQPIPPPGTYGGPQYYHQGYQTVPGYTVVEVRPMREHRLPCCGLGLSWFLFIMGFFLGGLPWYIGTFILICVHMDYREKPGLIACTVASAIAVIAVTFGITNKASVW